MARVLRAARRGVAVILVVAVVATAPAASAAPVFDCQDPAVRRQHPAQCPELGVPGILGGNPGSGGGGNRCGGLCGIVRDIVDRLPGVGGLL